MTDEQLNIPYYTPDSFDSYPVTANVLLLQNGHPTFDGNAEVGSGGGGYMRIRGRQVIDAGGSGGGVTSPGRNGYESSLGGGHGYFYLGYIMMQSNMFRIYPIVGTGGYGWGLNSEQTETPERDNKVTVGSGGVFFAFGVGADAIVSLWKLKLVFGIRVGYRLRVAKPVDGMDNPFPGFFFNVILGHQSK